MPEKVANKTIFSLLEVTKSIQRTLADRYKNLYWIKAEMNKLNHYKHSGHCYPELVEKKEGKIVAEIRSIIWKSDFERINNSFIKLLHEPLRDGITILFQAGISYDPLHGLSLRIVDIDPTFVLGELEREKKESILRLHQEGLFEANKRLPFPLIPKRLAIISVETSKGLSDFYKIINQNPWGYKIETTLYPALLQGDKSIPSIIKQLAVIAERAEAYDAVAIIRGGGGEVGLSSYNNYNLAKAIAIFPLPVLTGIGHSTNETVSEMVSYKNAITPSELADFLIQKFHNFSIPLDRLQEQLVVLSKNKFLVENSKLQAFAQSLSWESKNRLQQENHSIRILNQRLQLSSQHFFKDKYGELDNISRLINMADPIQLLKRGFSVTRINGKALQSLAEVKEGDTIETLLLDGKVKSTVTSTQ
ncbi:exodeoxyribonuclease VII large subunit [Sphingobacterium alimentarium]|uniref:Exodeoxyribonuclease 7 large subunit n=1 Tax=Sphingobacterium alimentarium TaxID=797292 RepID=A0A4R3VZN5_9SPHI|nr:exodeoxyribonuclease VII large subunit [Sphingobacterium alimentarium]TCV18881.1 exodeoxyribonuclease VII large subunit [Sphingobacterium alimentarium]